MAVPDARELDQIGKRILQPIRLDGEQEQIRLNAEFIDGGDDRHPQRGRAVRAVDAQSLLVDDGTRGWSTEKGHGKTTGGQAAADERTHGARTVDQNVAWSRRLSPHVRPH